MERHEALSLRLTQEVYTLTESNKLRTLFVTNLVYRGEEIRICGCAQLEDWETTNVHLYQDVYTSKAPLWKAIKEKMIAERDALQCKIDKVTEELE